MLSKPKLRAVESRWVEHRGQPALLLRDPLGLSDKSLLVPPAMAVLLSLCDGTRDVATLRASLMLRTGLELTPGQVEQAILQLDEALLLASPRFEQLHAKALAEYRQAPYRQPALAGAGYPADPAALRTLLDGYARSADGVAQPDLDGHSICGLISPHIDYHRGGTVYAKAWLPVAAAARAAELVIILGTDHAGMPGEITPTRQHYATPWGILPTDQAVVSTLCDAIGDEALAAELNHRREHSIELVTVWLHYLLGDDCPALVPILCGSFQHFVEGLADPESDRRLCQAVAALRQSIAGRRVLIVAAADLAHVGPAFGDSAPLGPSERRELEKADVSLLAAATTGNAATFFQIIRGEADRRRICGLPPIYLMLRLLEGAAGRVSGYAQCPADADGGSWVSVAAVVCSKAQH